MKGVQYFHFGRMKEESGPDHPILHAAFDRNQPNICEAKIAQSVRIGSVIVVKAYRNPLCEPHGGAAVKPVEAVIPGYVRPPTGKFEILEYLSIQLT